MIAGEFEAGPDHTIVVYTPPDAGVELDAVGTYFGQEGSGFQTRVAIAVVFEHWPAVPG